MNKVFFKTKKEAFEACALRIGHKVFKLKSGRNKGKFFVGTEFAWLNLD